MPQSIISRFRKEQILRDAGFLIDPYPVGPSGTPETDAELLARGTQWEIGLDRAYVRYLQAQQFPAVDPQTYIEVCEKYGIAAALIALNRGVPHRYTAAYRLERDILRNVELIDKAGEDRPEYLATVPLQTSFCQLVLRDGKFLTSDSGSDSRLDGHPYKGVMVAYHGVPIVDDRGALVGTLCHFDLEQQPLPDEEFDRLQSVGRVIHRFMPA